MFLKKLEISGFKSFANKVALEFIPACSVKESVKDGKKGKVTCGITGIVGPNGSGKSNVADAIRWIMGEQSMKNLRGKKSEDIIFAGSGKKSRLSSAWATLYFDNSDKRIPLEFSEVSITRKVFRSGESEYLINGSKVRLMDVADLLAKAGVGKESYCVINQGMTDSVLNASSIERRTILEDAAGVKQYQIKKERAERKLKSTKDNLERLGDLVKEIEPHLRMLKRQAEKAKKGKDLSQELREKQKNLYSYLWHSFQKERENCSYEKNETGAKMMNMQREVDKINDELMKESKGMQKNDKQDELRNKREETRDKINALEKELVITEGRIEIEKEKESQQKIIESIPVDLGYVRTKLDNIKKSQEKLITRIEGVEDLKELQDIKEFARAINQATHDLYQEAGKGKIELKREPSEKELEASKNVDEFTKKAEKLRGQLEELSREAEKMKEDIEEEVEKERKTRQRFFELEQEMHKKQRELDGLKDKFNEAKIRLAKVDVREEDLTHEIKNELRVEVSSLKYDGKECNKEKMEKEISRMKVQLEQIGGIDPLVVDEYEETNKRHEFLSKESEDLEKAIKSLKEIIKEMDVKIDEVFSKAYDQINSEFTKYFRIIFGGGNAHLIKTKIKNRRAKTEETEEEEDLNEEKEQKEQEEEEILGIDISACPPGKKITELSMLSGGERSLTSIALLFAIISYNPPPFTVLDEVDAALDEANSRRFGRILHELSDNTQFVIITHNRETMRQASLLYGVTMGEDGISKLLSVHLDQIGQGGKIVDKKSS